VRFLRPAASGDGLASNAFEAASGVRHGEAMESPGRELGPELYRAAAPVPVEPRARLFYRVRFAKRGDMRWLSHLDLMRLLQRAFKRARIEVSYSQGFHPQPLLSFGPALATGVESESEMFDFETAAPLAVAAAGERLNAALPAGVRVLGVEPLVDPGPSLSAMLDLAEYRAWINEARRALLPEEFAGLEPALFDDPRWQEERIASLLGRERIDVERRAKGDVVKTVDIRPWVRGVEYLDGERALRLELRLGPQGQAKPQEVLSALYAVPGTCFRLCRTCLSVERELQLL
jgi:radical SAM-linked protein